MTLLVLIGLFGVSGSASADGVDVGIRGGFYTDVDEPFIGKIIVKDDTAASIAVGIRF
jgi:hypothetical protein